MNKYQNSINLKVLILAGMAFVFIIPLVMIASLIEERSLARNLATEEMSDKWAKSQTILGPMIEIPYNIRIPKPDAIAKKDKWDYVTHYAYFLPEELSFDTDLKTELRKRSIYEVPLYRARMQIQGKFPIIRDDSFPKETTYIYYENARLIVSFSDAKGLGNEIQLSVNGKKNSVNPGTHSQLFPNGFHTSYSVESLEVESKFQINFDLLGSSLIEFVPIGKITKAKMTADWKDPSFRGNQLPKDRNISEEGFTAIWESNYYARSFPQTFSSMDFDQTMVSSSSFGVELIQAVDYYHKLDRATKYGILIIVISFALFFLFEVFGKVSLHPIQYILIGSAMIVFYTLTLSLSEHIGFLLAYSIASVITSLLIAYYTISILKGKKQGIIVGIYYLLLYLFIYIILSSEEYALLLGSFALFLVLAATMHLTRKIDWYDYNRLEH
ncbi:inner membrane protein CreD [Leptospira ryugenii]|uniref:Inner membrane protein CreD n=1 Tax=Leptospira ryugenii TaxID=1917863 RepID=A0A2P2E2D5_9LEPT|nr:cell envelope integrity protein CreD [Leptospira ryugenii]GBF51019.1 inner membrane protein CreD [Leptospira ryugenii]